MTALLRRLLARRAALVLAAFASPVVVPVAGAASPAGDAPLGLGPAEPVIVASGFPGTLPFSGGGGALLRAGGALAWPTAIQKGVYTGGSDGITLTVLRYLGTEPAITDQVVRGDDNLGIGYPPSTLSAVGGLDWFVSAPDRDVSSTDARPVAATPRLVALDSRDRVVRRIKLARPGGYANFSLLPYRSSLIVLVRRKSKTFFVDATGRRVGPILDLDYANGSVTAADGSVYVAGVRERKGFQHDSVVRLDTHGRLHTVDAGATKYRYRGGWGMAPAFGGVVLTEGIAGEDAEDASSAVALIRGNHTVRRLEAREIVFPGATACTAVAGQWMTVDDVRLGAAGVPIVRMHCLREGGRAPEPVAEYTVGLSSTLQPRWVQAEQSFAPMLTGPDGRLLEIGTSTVSAATERGAFAPARGFVRGRVRRSNGDALVTIVCRRPFGSVCNGRVVIRAGGERVGSAIYAAPGRPGAMAGVITRRVPLARGARRLTATLAPIEAQELPSPGR